MKNKLNYKLLLGLVFLLIPGNPTHASYFGELFQPANRFLVGPAAGVPAKSTFRLMVPADVPTLNQNTTGTAANLSGTPALPNGTTATTQAPADNSTRLSTTAYVDAGLSTVQATIPTSAAVADQFVTGFTSPGTFTRAQPAFTNISGVAVIAQGGTNSSAALNNDRVIVSSGGAIVEHTALTADRVLYTNGVGLPAASTITATELGYLGGVTSSIQTQITSKKATFTVYSEAPVGVVDGVNTVFTPQRPPTETASYVLSVDGGVTSQTAGANGYTVGGSTITFGTAPAVGQDLWLIYH